jgi:putative hydrolase of the HAD superfamily
MYADSLPPNVSGPSTPVETVLFDLDGTLLTYDQDPDEVLAEAYDRAGVEPFCEPTELWSLADRVGDVETDHEFLTELWSVAADRHGGPSDGASHEALARANEAATDHSAVSFRPGAEVALDHVADGGHDLGVVTNGSRRTQRQKLEALSLDDHFETVVYAGEDTAPKPDREPFDLALSHLDGRPGTSLYVGNSLEHDVVGAQRAGLRVAWLPGPFDPTDPGEHAPDHHLGSLTELRDVL